MQLKAKTKKFIELLNLVKLTGKDGTGSVSDLMYGCLLKATNNEGNNLISVNCLSQNGVGIVNLKYKTISVVEPGELPIGDIQEFLSCLNRFGLEEEIDINTVENKIVIKREKPSKKINLNITAVENIAEYGRAEEVSQKITQSPENVVINETTLDVKIELKAEDVKEILKDADIKNIARRFHLFTEEGKIIVTIGNDNATLVKNELSSKSLMGVCNSIYIAGFDNIFSTLSGEITLFLKTESPMAVIQTTDEYEILYIISPVVEKEE